MGLLATIIGVGGNIAALILFLVPAKTFNTIRKKQSTLEFSGVPYGTTLLNCLLWVLYGLPINKGNVLIMTINSAGIVIQTVYVLLFIYYASSWKARRNMLGLLALDIIVTAVLGVGVIVGARDKDQRILILGIACVVLNIGMYYAPLSVMWMVIKTKSSEYMPFLLSLMVLVNSSFWAVYSFLVMDLYIIIPNTLGLAGGVVQMILYFCFRKPAKKVDGDGEVQQEGKGDIEIAKMEHKQNSTRSFS